MYQTLYSFPLKMKNIASLIKGVSKYKKLYQHIMHVFL